MIIYLTFLYFLCIWALNLKQKYGCEKIQKINDLGTLWLCHKMLAFRSKMMTKSKNDDDDLSK